MTYPKIASDITIGRHYPVKGIAAKRVISARVFNYKCKNGDPKFALFQIH